MATGAVAAGAVVPDPDAGLGTGAGEEASNCCKRRLGCSTFRGLNLKKRDEREEGTTATDVATHYCGKKAPRDYSITIHIGSCL